MRLLEAALNEPELRLARARLLLLQTELPVLEVALACGFVSASHFSKCYRDVYGCTPRDQRQAMGFELVIALAETGTRSRRRFGGGCFWSAVRHRRLTLTRGARFAL